MSVAFDASNGVKVTKAAEVGLGEEFSHPRLIGRVGERKGIVKTLQQPEPIRHDAGRELLTTPVEGGGAIAVMTSSTTESPGRRESPRQGPAR